MKNSIRRSGKKREVIIETCSTSNMIIVLKPGVHPLGCFVSKGLRVLLGTDDPLVLNTDVLAENALEPALRC
ncbi:hypothetical protein [Ignicoccus hospitalis]|uniref:hypothetical protein n=1 Tax=Ignicoccus hospitalis TaxID=160233 RepID=UPI0003219BBA|nr:hypothetical protein [Ignicoccus hospitalis]HIH90153.1 hypothetical protein [Desulfurococcaceae archaeon]